MAPNYFDSMNRLAGELFGTRPGQPAEGGAERGGGTRPRPRRSWRPGADPSRYERADRRPADARRVRPNAGVSRTRAEALAHRRGGRFGFGRETVTHRWQREDAPTRATRLGALASATNELRSRAELAADIRCSVGRTSQSTGSVSELRAERRDSYACGRPRRGRVSNATARLIRSGHLEKGGPQRRATGRRSTAEPAQASGLSAFGGASARLRPWRRAYGQPGRRKDFAELRPPVPV